MEFWRRNEIIRDKTIDFFFESPFVAASLSFTITILRNTRASKESKERGGRVTWSSPILFTPRFKKEERKNGFFLVRLLRYVGR